MWKPEGLIESKAVFILCSKRAGKNWGSGLNQKRAVELQSSTSNALQGWKRMGPCYMEWDIWVKAPENPWVSRLLWILWACRTDLSEDSHLAQSHIPFLDQPTSMTDWGRRIKVWPSYPNSGQLWRAIPAPEILMRSTEAFLTPVSL